jgi:carbonic anhydrase
MDDFATAITCIDGRVQQPVSDWVRLHMNVRYVDLITEPGPDKVVAEAQPILSDMIRKVKFSLRHHNSNVVVLSGHHDCAANHASKEEHIEHILEGLEVLRGYELQARLVGVWLNEWNSVDLIHEVPR